MDVPDVARLEAMLGAVSFESEQNQVETSHHPPPVDLDELPAETPESEPGSLENLALCSCICGCQLRSINGSTDDVEPIGIFSISLGY